MNLRQFREWAISQRSVDIPGGSTNPPGRLRGQCVSLIQQYLFQVFQKPFRAYGHARDWATNYPRDFFNRLEANATLQRGDVLVYGSNMGGGFGHMGLIDDRGQFLDQNGVIRLAVGTRQTPFAGFICILRPINQARLGLSSSFTTGRYRVNTTLLNVRRDPSTNNPPLRFGELTPNAQEQVRRLTGGGNANGLVRGVVVDVSEVRGEWGRIPSGWISLNYCVRI